MSQAENWVGGVLGVSLQPNEQGVWGPSILKATALSPIIYALWALTSPLLKMEKRGTKRLDEPSALPHHA